MYKILNGLSPDINVTLYPKKLNKLLASYFYLLARQIEVDKSKKRNPSRQIQVDKSK